MRESCGKEAHDEEANAAKHKKKKHRKAKQSEEKQGRLNNQIIRSRNTTSAGFKPVQMALSGPGAPYRSRKGP
jgi:hypothetical protein